MLFRSGAANVEVTVPVVFTLGTDPACPRLRRGLYLIGWRATTAPALGSWRRYRARTGTADSGRIDDTGPMVRLIDNRTARSPADFRCLALAIDHGLDRNAGILEVHVSKRALAQNNQLQPIAGPEWATSHLNRVRPLPDA